MLMTASTRDQLTDRQVQVLSVLTHLYETQGIPPTSRELAAKLRIAQTTLLYQLRRLQRAGKVRQVRGFYLPVVDAAP
jgi:DNA-binding MarR family transcriptional regulator